MYIVYGIKGSKQRLDYHRNMRQKNLYFFSICHENVTVLYFNLHIFKRIFSIKTCLKLIVNQLVIELCLRKDNALLY